MKDLQTLKRILRDHKKRLCDQYGVTEIGVFGSYVKNAQVQASDIDILVEFSKAIDLLTFVHLKHELSDLLGVEVDLVSKKALKPAIGKRILQEVVYV